MGREERRGGGGGGAVRDFLGEDGEVGREVVEGSGGLGGGG